MGSYEDERALDDAYVMHTYGRLPVEFVAGHGAVLVDDEGTEYLDFLGGIGCMSLGHCHPAVVATLREQAGRLWQASNYFYAENRGELARELSELLATTTDEAGHETGCGDDTWRVFFANSGGEANEAAIKCARRWGELRLGGAHTVVSARQSFHGRTLATLAATGQDRFHERFRPMPEGFDYVPLNDLDALAGRLARGGVCAVMLECVQGEGGVHPADLAYLRGVERLCRESGALLVIDEVQTGFYRTGAPFSFQLAGIVPDVVSMAKGIAAGFPMGACAARGEAGELLGPGDHGSTFGGNALACAVGRTTVETLRSEGMGEHVIEAGAHLAERLGELPHVAEVRGRGLLQGVELDVPVASEVVDEGIGAHLVLNHIGDSVLRFLPPLVVSDAQIDEMASRLAGVIAHAAKDE